MRIGAQVDRVLHEEPRGGLGLPLGPVPAVQRLAAGVDDEHERQEPAEMGQDAGLLLLGRGVALDDEEPPRAGVGEAAEGGLALLVDADPRGHGRRHDELEGAGVRVDLLQGGRAALPLPVAGANQFVPAEKRGQ